MLAALEADGDDARLAAAARREGFRAHGGVRCGDRGLVRRAARANASRSDSQCPLERAQTLRYGENPGQRAAFYVERAGAGLAALEQKGGKELSFNNLLDLEGALLATDPFDGETCCAIIKHTTPCGLATGTDALDAYQKALACDPVRRSVR